MQTETEGHLPFLDILTGDPTALWATVYRKPTRTNLYLNTKSHHHPSNIQAVLSTMVHRVRAMCDEDKTVHGVGVPEGLFRRNSYKDQQIQNVLNCRPNTSKPDKKPSTVAFLPYAGHLFNRVRVLN
jgi:hypothetical protein